MNRFLIFVLGISGATMSSAQFRPALGSDIELPNICSLSQNSDGMNDVLEFKNLEFFKDSRLVVTNRWGHVVCDEPRYNTRNNCYRDYLAGHVYYYVLTMPDGADHVGTLTLTR